MSYLRRRARSDIGGRERDAAISNKKPAAVLMKSAQNGPKCLYGGFSSKGGELGVRFASRTAFPVGMRAWQSTTAESSNTSSPPEAMPPPY
eukprot:6175205-Pleurochrysis_carterae.AAC.3